MKILQVNATDSGGGAANACKRLTEALAFQGVNIKLFSQKQKAHKEVYNHYLITNKIQKILYFSRHLKHQFKLRSYNYKGNNFSPSLYSASIWDHQLIKEADIIHLHWINDSFLSPEEIYKIGKTGKKIVWTLHDMWPFTGGCHYSGSCLKYVKNCGACPELNSKIENDISRKIHLLKKKYFSDLEIQIITPSKWLANIAAKSSLFYKSNIIAIPNALNTDLFKPSDKQKLRQNLSIPEGKKIILFGAVAAIEDERKGFKYLVDSLNIIAKKQPELKDEILLAIFGSDKVPEIELPFEYKILGKLKTDLELVNAYNLADMLVTPSLQDNLPTTIMEAMSCEVPVIGFEIGGIPEMIEHKINGYVVKPRSSEDFASGIMWVLNNLRINPALKINARVKAVNDYSYQVIAQKHKQLYSNLI